MLNLPAVRKAVSRVLCGAGVVVLACSAFGGTQAMRDALIFDLGLLNPRTDGAAPATSDIVNLVTWSSENRVTANGITTYVDDGVSPLARNLTITNQLVSHSLYADRGTVQPTLHIPLNTNWVDGVLYIFPQCVRMPPLVCGSNITVFARFRWDDNVPFPGSGAWVRNLINNNVQPHSGSRWYGWALAYQPSSVTTPTSTAYSRHGNQGIDYGVSFAKNRWTSYCETFEMTAADTYRLTSYVLSFDGKPSPTVVAVDKSHSNVEVPASVLTSRCNLYVGGNSSSFGKTGWVKATNDNLSNLCGSLAKLQVYNRILTKGEIFTLMSDCDGQNFAAGSENGRADEFAAADDDDLAEVFEPKTMPMRRMRRELTSDHPTLTLKFPLPIEEIGLAKLLHIKPILSGTGARADFRVTVNGVFAANGDFVRPASADVFIRKRFMTRDADGNVTLAITRTGDLSGTVAIDAVSLGGSWQAGSNDATIRKAGNAFAGFTTLVAPERDETTILPIGGTVGLPYMVSGLYGPHFSGSGAYCDVTTIALDVPPAVTNLPSRYTMRTGSFSYSTGGIYTNAFTVTVNGTLKREFRPIYVGDYTVEFEPGELRAGSNLLQIRNVGKNVLVSGCYPEFRIDKHRFEFDPPKTGFLMLVK